MSLDIHESGSADDCGTLKVDVWVVDPVHDAEVAALADAAAQRKAAEAAAKRAADAAAEKAKADKLRDEARLKREADEREAKRIRDAAEKAERDRLAALALMSAQEQERKKAEHAKFVKRIHDDVCAGRAVNHEGRTASAHVDDGVWYEDKHGQLTDDEKTGTMKHHVTFWQHTYYCGKQVGQAGYANPCGFCDGTCGPTNGCQCKACHRLSFGERLNADGVIAVPRQNPKHHSNGAVLHYCGRKAGEHSGYANACGKCDGTCGPEDGCQCKGCWAIDHDAQGKPRGHGSCVTLNSSDKCYCAHELYFAFLFTESSCIAVCHSSGEF